MATKVLLITGFPSREPPPRNTARLRDRTARPPTTRTARERADPFRAIESGDFQVIRATARPRVGERARFRIQNALGRLLEDGRAGWVRRGGREGRPRRYRRARWNGATAGAVARRERLKGLSPRRRVLAGPARPRPSAPENPSFRAVMVRPSGRYSRPEVAARAGSAPPGTRRSRAGWARGVTETDRVLEAREFVRGRLNGLLISAFPENARSYRRSTSGTRPASLDISQPGRPSGQPRGPRGAALAGTCAGLTGPRRRFNLRRRFRRPPVPRRLTLPPSLLWTGSGGPSRRARPTRQPPTSTRARRDESPLLFKGA